MLEPNGRAWHTVCVQTDLSMSACNSSRPALLCVVLVALFATAACKDEGGVKVTSLKFNGLEAVEPAQLTDILATGASSKLPWGEKRYFSREQFEADLKRIVAFYRDRGYPNAKVTSFDVQLSEDQTSVDIVLNIAEGEPIVAQRVALEGFDVLPDASRAGLAARLPLQDGQPLDRSLMQASREAALEELKEEGYPYASVRMGETDGGRRQRARRDADGRARAGGAARRVEHPGQLERQRQRHPPAADVQAGRSLPPEQAAREPAEALRPRGLPVRQRPDGAGGRGGADRHPDADHRDGRQAPQGQLQPRLRHRREGTGRG